MVIEPNGNEHLSTPGCNLRGARRSDPAGDPCASRFWQGFGDGTGRAFCDDPAGHFETPQGAGAGGPDFAEPRRAKASVPPGSETAPGGYRMAGKLPPVLGGQLRTLGRAA